MNTLLVLKTRHDLWTDGVQSYTEEYEIDCAPDSPDFRNKLKAAIQSFTNQHSEAYRSSDFVPKVKVSSVRLVITEEEEQTITAANIADTLIGEVASEKKAEMQKERDEKRAAEREMQNNAEYQEFLRLKGKFGNI